VKVPIDGTLDITEHGLGNESVTCHNSGLRSEGLLNDEIRHVVSDDRLKTIPHIGYLLTPDTTTDESVKISNTHTTTLSDQGRRLLPTIFQELVFNSQWFISGYQRSPRAWAGIFVFTAMVLLSSVVTKTSSTAGHIAYDRTDVNACVNRFAICAACVPNIWQTSSKLAYSNWFLSSGCNQR